MPLPRKTTTQNWKLLKRCLEKKRKIFDLGFPICGFLPRLRGNCGFRGSTADHRKVCWDLLRFPKKFPISFVLEHSEGITGFQLRKSVGQAYTMASAPIFRFVLFVNIKVM